MQADDTDLTRFDIASLERAIRRVEKALRIARSELAADPELAEEFRQSTIQTFEFTYELTVKTLVRFLRYVPAVIDAEKLSFQQLVRVGREQDIFSADLATWTLFRTMRNRSSHAYDEQTAIEVFSAVPKFLEEARYALNALQRRIAQGA